ncbi:hypothetical protein C8A05DRAFT_32469 [Staphylotrichum tortipilum]|uniref:Nucleolar protein 12 n=1 Tax=Staphylotrichum tortipilum TaxID=2831512 RepID=A0AAN6RV98_9PEZI|nr:hypothetical protein C8A05DRAFT_32469 [Staphylotrichum longicolle]
MAKAKSMLAVKSKAIDPTLDALFSQSAGAVKTPPKSRYADLLPQKSRSAPEQDEEEDEAPSDSDEDEDEDGSEQESGQESDADGSGSDVEALSADGESDAEDAEDASSVDDEAEAAQVLEQAVAGATSQDERRKRKRKNRDDDENLEANYLERLANEEEPSGKRRKGDAAAAEKSTAPDKDEVMADEDDGDEVPVHESLAGGATTGSATSELEKANRTVFLSNVSIEAITSSKAKKKLLTHLASVLDKEASPPQTVQSIRFRSTAFETAGIPKRAAYINKSVMKDTTEATNAYAVFSTTAAARLAVKELNGTIVLDRHLRVDSVAHPAPVDHRRCVFVGNLGFVNDETVFSSKLDEEGKEVTEKRKRTKAPMDVEEGLWRVFGKEAGKVESVRVVRDPATRVGKGIAYVQFYDGNDVEAAILLNGKKFPPMLPRELRVSRCKAPHKTARAMEARMGKSGPPSSSNRRGGGKDRDGDKKGRRKSVEDTGRYVPKPTAESQTLAGRASKLLGRFGAAQFAGKPQDKKRNRDRRERGMNRGGAAGSRGGGEAGEKNGFKAPEQFVFEGRRASAKDGKPKDLKFKGANKGKDPRHKKRKSGNFGK